MTRRLTMCTVSAGREAGHDSGAGGRCLSVRQSSSRPRNGPARPAFAARPPGKGQ